MARYLTLLPVLMILFTSQVFGVEQSYALTFGFTIETNFEQADKRYEQILKERISDKLGMDSTCVDQCNELRDRFAKPHSLGNQTKEIDMPDEMAGAEGVRSSGKDTLTFLSYEMNLKDSELKKIICVNSNCKSQNK